MADDCSIVGRGFGYYGCRFANNWPVFWRGARSSNGGAQGLIEGGKEGNENESRKEGIVFTYCMIRLWDEFPGFRRQPISSVWIVGLQC